MNQQEAKWREEFEVFWEELESNEGHQRSPSNRNARKAYLAAKKAAQADLDQLKKHYDFIYDDRESLKKQLGESENGIWGRTCARQEQKIIKLKTLLKQAKPWIEQGYQLTRISSTEIARWSKEVEEVLG